MAVITNFNCLHKKYGEYVEAIRAQLALFEDSLRSRGIFCQVVDISDDATMSSIGAAAVPDISDEESTKKAIEATCEILNPAYITLIGGPDVVCHQNLTNPFYHPPYDVDEIIPSDLPYAAQSNYSPEISSHLSIVRAVGRIPDIPGAAEPSLLLAALKAAAMPIPSSDRIFGLSTDTWAVSTRLSIASLGRKFDLHLSPSEGPVWTDRQMRRNLHFINCHGGPIYPHFLGEPGHDDEPKAHSANLISNRIAAGTVAVAECCYGAEIYDPFLGSGDMGIALTYIEGGASAFFGSTNIAYGPPDRNDQADLMCADFMRSVISGTTTGYACAEARQRYIAGKPILTAIDLKTIAQFTLLGNPAAAILPTSHSVLGKSSRVLVSEPSLRQLNLVSNGRGLSYSAAYTVPSRAANQHGASPELLQVARSYGFFDTSVQAFDVITPIEGKAFRRNIRVQTFSKRATSALSSLPATEVLEVIFDDLDILSSATTASK